MASYTNNTTMSMHGDNGSMIIVMPETRSPGTESSPQRGSTHSVMHSHGHQPRAHEDHDTRSSR